MSASDRNQEITNKLIRDAITEEFIKVFYENIDALYQLSFLLTADHEKAEKCFVAGIEDCVKENRMFGEWARSWAKRIILGNAIREVKPRPRLPASSPSPTALSQGETPSDSDGHFVLETVLRLGDFERFVFVMSVLEKYSHLECALLLDCSVSEIRQGRLFALDELVSSRQVFSFAP